MSQPPVSRRQRLHEATAEEIKAVARGLMAREGTSSLNLRAVAREMGMTASALYRYFPSRDAILTALITDAYEAVGAAVEKAALETPLDGSCTRMLACVHAFRRWALEHPQEYGLIYGTPVPGYEAPAEDTLEAAMRTNAVLLGELARAVEMGMIRLPPDESIPEPLRDMLCEMSTHEQKAELGLPVAGWAVAMQFWVVLYGAINAEVFAHMPPMVLEHSAEFFDHTMRRTLAVIGVDQTCIDAGVSPDY
jgi:AcrR family transcriptional regulator